MKNSVKLSPSIIAADYLKLGEEIRGVEKAGVDYLHVDVMDGHFVPNLTVGPELVAAIKPATTLPLDVHLMIANADTCAMDYVKAGAAVLTVHLEAVRHLHKLIHEVKGNGVKAGVAINPSTPVEALSEILVDLDLVNVMSVNPGFYGQAFIPGTLEKIRKLRRMVNERNLNVEIEVDGGVKLENIAAVAKAGANVFVSGSGIFRCKPYDETVRSMRRLAESAGA